MFSLGVMDENKRHIASYNGYVPSFMPKAGGGRKYLQMEIDLETGQILNWKNPMGSRKFNAILKDGAEGVPKTIYISAYCPHHFEMSVVNAKWEEIASYYGNVPFFMPCEGGYGDYVQMEIDIETGEILDWENPVGDSEFEEIVEFGRRVPKRISISAHCRDSFCMSVRDKNGKWIANYSGGSGDSDDSDYDSDDDGYVPSFMPGGGGYGDAVEMEIELETGKILDWENPNGNSEFDKMIEKSAGDKVPKIISFSAKCSDCFSMSVWNENDRQLASYQGYVPSFIPGEYGDYVAMKIDIETGRILNWKNPIGDSNLIDIIKGRADGCESDYY